MSAKRCEQGGCIDRSQPLDFTFDGKAYRGYHGDTVASALLAAGVTVVGRSFKYHRPRGLWGSWTEEPNAIMDIRLGDYYEPNCLATRTPLMADMQICSVNTAPNAERDWRGVFDRLYRLLPAGFYYKTFMWPHWHWYEHVIRQSAGLGRVDVNHTAIPMADQRHAHYEVVVIGAGPAGLLAARRAAEKGHSVLLADDRARLGGSLLRTRSSIDGENSTSWIESQKVALTSLSVTVLPQTTAIGIYDHNSVLLSQDFGFSKKKCRWLVRAEKIILATGAIERPFVCGNNDVPRVMSADAALDYANHYGVLVGKNIALFSNNTLTNHVAASLEQAGAKVHHLEAAKGDIPLRVQGKKQVVGVSTKKHPQQIIECDTVLFSAGWTPSVHLWCHAGGKLQWRDDITAFVPKNEYEKIQVIGAANGCFDLAQACEEASQLFSDKKRNQHPSSYRQTAVWPDAQAEGRQWVDFQHDVTLKDVALAHRENYQSVEHLKRYTTLGMASDQGKTANMSALMALAEQRGVTVPEVGTTTFRPPYTPVLLEHYRGVRRDALYHPVKRLALEALHREQSAVLREYGGILRPAFYGKEKNEAEAIARETIAARNSAVLFDASPLGKIEVLGPDAAAFLDFICYHTVSTLKAGRIRYVLLLTESGSVFDDGVVTRIADKHFVLSCSSSHVDAVLAQLEAWRQDQFDPSKVFVHNTTGHWATLSLSGPKSPQVLERLDWAKDFADLPFMHFKAALFDGNPVRVAHVSFTGETGFEISIASGCVTQLWRELSNAGQPEGILSLGVESMAALRAEKGYVIVGKDTDGETQPQDIGHIGPREKKQGEFVGKRGLWTSQAKKENRKQLVGLALCAEDSEPLPTGAHLMRRGLEKPVSEGFVTSSYFSRALSRPIALALLQAGTSRWGEVLDVWHMGKTRRAKVVSPVFYENNHGK